MIKHILKTAPTIKNRRQSPNASPNMYLLNCITVLGGGLRTRLEVEGICTPPSSRVKFDAVEVGGRCQVIPGSVMVQFSERTWPIICRTAQITRDIAKGGKRSRTSIPGAFGHSIHEAPVTKEASAEEMWGSGISTLLSDRL